MSWRAVLLGLRSMPCVKVIPSDISAPGLTLHPHLTQFPCIAQEFACYDSNYRLLCFLVTALGVAGRLVSLSWQASKQGFSLAGAEELCC